MRRLLLPAMLLSAVGATAQTSYDIGQHGASVELDAPWKRQKMSPDLGEDQFSAAGNGLFARGAQVFAVVMELESLLECETDYERVLNQCATVGHDERMQVVREAGRVRVTRSADADVNGMRVSFRCELLVYDGLAWHVMLWAPRSAKKQLDERAEQFCDGFEPPGLDSAWQRGRAPQPMPVTVGSLSFELAVRTAALQVQTDQGELLGLRSGDDMHLVSVTEAELSGDLDAVLDAERETLQDWDDSYVEKARGRRDAGGRVCGWLRGATRLQAIESLIAPAGPDRWVTIRYQAVGAIGDARPERERLLGSLRIRQVEGLLDLPPVAAQENERAKGPLARFLDEGERIATWSGWLQGAVPYRDGWLVWDWQDVAHLTPTGVESKLAGASGVRFAVAWGDDVLVGANDDQVRRVADGTLADAGFTARCACPLGDDLLLVRGAPVLMSAAWQPRHRSTLLRRSRGGDERLVADLGLCAVDRIAVDAPGQRALVTVRGAGLELRPDAIELRSVELETGAVLSLGSWQQIEMIATCAEGWLVSGTPAGAPAGAWLIGADGTPEVLVTGNVRALACSADTVTLAWPSFDQLAVMTVSRASCRDAGRFCQPFGSRQIDEIGRRLLAGTTEGPPRTRQQFDAVWRRTQQIARDTAGAELPTDAEELDELMNSGLGWMQRLGHEGRVVLGLAVAAAALTAGAEWVDAQQVEWHDVYLHDGAFVDSVAAIVCAPGAHVAAALDDSEGAAALTYHLAEARGRTILVGLDDATLAARAPQRTPPDLQRSAETGDAGRLETIFAEHEQNVELRARVYDLLVAHGHENVVERLAAPLARRAAPCAADVVAWLDCQGRRELDAAAARQHFDACLRATGQLPRDVRVAMLLARAVARAYPGDTAKVRQCYQRVLELQQWGTLADEARAALGH